MKTGLLIVATMVMLGVTGIRTSSADVRRERPARRPYIVEIGYPYAINARRLDIEIAHLNELRSFVGDFGLPDYAEIQEISPEWPWIPYEVRLYYLRSNVEADFGPVALNPELPNFGVLKFHGEITPAKRHEIELVLQSRLKPAPPAPVRVSPPSTTEAEPSPRAAIAAAVERIEAAAARAEAAADRAVTESEAAVRAADRTVNVVNKLQSGAE